MVRRPMESWLLHWDVDDIQEGEAAHRLITELGLRDAVLQRRGGPGGGSVYVRIQGDDPRLSQVLSWLQEHRIEPRVWRSRKYSAGHRQRADWLWGTCGATSVTIDWKRQGWDRSAACKVCGAGASAVPPLHLDHVVMPRGGLTGVCGTGHLVATEEVARTLLDGGLTGIQPHRTARKNPRGVRQPLVWLDTPYVWPRFQNVEGWKASEVCPDCGRAGYFMDLSQAPFEPQYVVAPHDAPDLGRSFEQWGYWGSARSGAAPLLIISQRAFRLLRALNIRLSFDPVSVGDEQS